MRTRQAAYADPKQRKHECRQGFGISHEAVEG